MIEGSIHIKSVKRCGLKGEFAAEVCQGCFNALHHEMMTRFLNLLDCSFGQVDDNKIKASALAVECGGDAGNMSLHVVRR